MWEKQGTNGRILQAPGVGHPQGRHRRGHVHHVLLVIHFVLESCMHIFTYYLLMLSFSLSSTLSFFPNQNMQKNIDLDYPMVYQIQRIIPLYNSYLRINMNLSQYLIILLVSVHPVHQDTLLSNNTGSIQIEFVLNSIISFDLAFFFKCCPYL